MGFWEFIPCDSEVRMPSRLEIFVEVWLFLTMYIFEVIEAHFIKNFFKKKKIKIKKA